MSKPLLVLFLLMAVAGYSQVSVSGKVTDDSGLALPGVNVILKGTTIGTVTNANGTYTLSDLPKDGILSFTFIGYNTQEVAVANQSVIDIKLLANFTALEEVIVVGYGVQKKSVATASLSKVDSKDLAGFSIPRVDQMLQGQVSGVTFKSSSGQPGSGMNIFIRGVGTNGDNSPLIIIDGLVANDGILQSISPTDIESVEVLKDGASTAIYGARGANGIIIVTTKKAKAGTATFNFSSNVGMQSPWRLPTMLNSAQYIELTREQFANDNRPVPADFPNLGDATPSTNWMDVIFEPGSIQNHQLSVSKGTENSTVFSSLSYFEQKGVISPEKSKLQRITLRLNSENKINSFLTFGENLFITHSHRKSIPENNAFGTPIADAIALDPLTPVYDDARMFGFAQSKWVQKEYVNPLSRIYITNNDNYQDGVAGNAFLKINILKELSFKTDLGFDYNIYTGNAFTPSYSFSPSFKFKSNSTSAYSTKKYRWQWENYFAYSKAIKNHTIDLTAGMTVQERYDDADPYSGGMGLSASSNGVDYDVQLNPAFWYINSSPDSATARSWKQERTALRSFFGRVNYNYDQKYLFSFTLRQDASTVFGPGNSAGVFPSVSAGWVISKENFFPETAVNFLKFRASYGVNGNDRIPPLRYASTIERSGGYPFGKPDLQAVYNGLSSTYSSNRLVAWEESIQTDVGLEIGLWNDNLTIELDYFNKKTSGLLMQETVLAMTGTNPPYGNVGTVVNKGFEIEANYQHTFGELNLRLGVTASTLTNNVTDVSNGGAQFGYTWPVRNLVISQMDVGNPIGYFRGRKTDGIFRNENEIYAYINANGDPIQPNAQPGDLKFIDTNGDGKIDDNDMVNIGKPWPDFTLGFNMSAAYKGFDLRALFAGSFGNDIYKTYERGDVPYNNFQSTWLDRWSESNPNGSYPRLTYVDTNGNQKPSDFYVSDGSYVRLRNLQVGYTVPSTILTRAKLTQFRLYVSADNLLTFTKYDGFDPEIGTSGWILDTSIDKGFYPQMKSFTVGINASF